MAQDINFLAKQQRIVEARVAKDRQSTYIVLGIVAVLAAIYGIIWYLNSRLDNQISQVQDQITSVQSQITSENNQEVGYLAFYEKLSKLSGLLAARSGGTQALIDTYRHFLTPDTSLVDSTYDYKSRQLSLSLITSSALSLSRLYDLIQDPEFTSQYQAVRLGTLNRSSDGSYRLSITIEL